MSKYQVVLRSIPTELMPEEFSPNWDYYGVATAEGDIPPNILSMLEFRVPKGTPLEVTSEYTRKTEKKPATVN